MASISGDIGIAAKPRKWDIVVRLTHWSIVAAVIVNALVTEDGSAVHVWVGYGLAAVLALRLIWGLIGPKEARFTAFPPSPSAAIAHIREIVAGRNSEHASHNPLGALMVYAVWATLAVIIGSGIAMAGLPGSARAPEARVTGSVTPAAAMIEDDDDDDQSRTEARGGEGRKHEESPFEEVHEVAVNLLYLLIALHLAGVVFESRRSGRQIVMAMLKRQA